MIPEDFRKDKFLGALSGFMSTENEKITENLILKTMFDLVVENYFLKDPIFLQSGRKKYH